MHARAALGAGDQRGEGGGVEEGEASGIDADEAAARVKVALKLGAQRACHRRIDVAVQSDRGVSPVAGRGLDLRDTRFGGTV